MKSDSYLRKILIKDVQNRLQKIFIGDGFRHYSLSKKELNSELKKVFPLGRLKRNRDKYIEIIEFQFDKFGKPKFVINFGIIPENGVDLPWGAHLNQDEADCSALLESYRLYSCPILEKWFGLGLFSAKNDESLKIITNKAIELSSEIFDWFQYRKVGRHMKKFGLLAHITDGNTRSGL